MLHCNVRACVCVCVCVCVCARSVSACTLPRTSLVKVASQARTCVCMCVGVWVCTQVMTERQGGKEWYTRQDIAQCMQQVIGIDLNAATQVRHTCDVSISHRTLDTCTTPKEHSGVPYVRTSDMHACVCVCV